MFELRMGYPSKDDEERIVIATTGSTENEIVPVLHGSQLIELQRLVRRITAPPTKVK